MTRGLRLIQCTKRETQQKSKEVEFLYPFDRVLIITSEGAKKNYLKIHTNCENTFLYRSSLVKLMSHLPPHFIQISKSTIINPKFLSARARPNKILLHKDKWLSVSDSFKGALNDYINEQFK